MILQLLTENKRVINIYESWILQTDFRNQKWRQRGDKNLVPLIEMRQRVNAITAIDFTGNIYHSITQVNTDSNIMLMFFSRLAMTLSSEEKDWRKNTVFLLDGVLYQKSTETRAHLNRLRV